MQASVDTFPRMAAALLSEPVKRPVRQVLVIEDDSNVTYALRRKLRQYGYDVVSEQRGDLGFAAAMALAPDVVLLDLGLPGMPGVDVLDKLRADAPQVPVVIITGQWEQETLLQTWSNVRGFFRKPFRATRLAEFLNKLFGERS